jgi:hypothetical protein
MAAELLYRLRGESKICTKCKQAKPRAEFPLQRGRERARCKVCHTEDAMNWAKNNGEKRRVYHRAWIAANPDKVKASAKKAYANRSPESVKKKNEYRKLSHLARKYGMTQTDWDAMYAAQGGVCAICKVPGRVGKHGKLAVDHCHNTGRIRGLLCTPCNISIGILGETPEQWEVVHRYLRGD